MLRAANLAALALGVAAEGTLSRLLGGFATDMTIFGIYLWLRILFDVGGE